MSDDGRPPRRRRARGRRRPAPAAGVGGRRPRRRRRARPRRGPHQHGADARPHHPHLAAPAPQRVEERNHIRRWNDAGITRIKRREPSALWIATTHATKLDEVAAEARRAAPGRPRAPGAGDRARGRRRGAGRARPRRRRAPRSRGAGPRALAAGSAPLVVAGCSSGSAELVRAAAQLAAALRRAGARRAAARARRRSSSPSRSPTASACACSAAARLVAGAGRRRARRGRGRRGARQRPGPPRPRAARRRPAAPRRAGRSRWPTLEDRLTARADVVLPAATFAEETGTWVSHEGRAQRYFAVLPPRRRRAPGLALAARAAGAARAPGGARLDDARRRAGRARDGAAAVPRRRAPPRRPPAGAGTAARSPASRCAGAGAPPLDADRTVFEPGADARPGLAARLLARGPAAAAVAGRAPAPATWSPGWNSNNGLHKFGEELEARAARRGPPASACSTAPPGRELPPVAARRRASRRATASSLLVAAAPHLRLRATLSMYTPGIARARAGAVHRPQRGGRRAARACARATCSSSGCRGWTRARRFALVPSLVDRHGRGARRPPRPALHLAAGARRVSRALEAPS